MNVKDNTPEAQAMRLARGMINVVLATALEEDRRGVFTTIERKAIRAEAARRLRWRNEYEKTAS